MSFLGILGSPFPAIFAILLSEIKSKKFSKLIQTATTLPNFISWVIVFSLAFSFFSNDGFVNSMMARFNIHHQEGSGILGNNDAVWLFQWGLQCWKGLGWGAIIYLATIAGIDTALYDAAKVDGANRFQAIIHITVPGLFMTYLVLLLLGISNMLNNGFDQYFVFYNALVADKIEVLDYYVYKVGMLSNDYSLSTALGMAKTIISLILLFTANNISQALRGERLV
jgi:putative aldouronate transport system permease protein